MSSPLFTASQIAEAMGLEVRSVRKRLESVRPDCELPHQGNLTKFWSLADLPDDYRARLTIKANRLGCDSPAGLLTGKSTQWEPPVKDIRRDDWIKAAKLFKALAKPLAQQHSGLSSVALTELGLDEYQKEFGHRPCAKTWNKIFDRTVQRAGAGADFSRQCIYLDDSAFRPAPVVSEAQQDRVVQYSHSELNGNFIQVADLTKPTAEEKANVLNAIFRHYERLLAENPHDAKGIRVSLVEYAHAAMPALSDSREGIFKLWQRSYERWIAGDRKVAALLDKRTLKASKITRPDFAEDIDLLIRKAGRDCGAQLSLAHRLLHTSAEYTQEFRDRYPLNLRKHKSHVPHGIRELAKGPALALHHALQGSNAIRDHGPTCRRDWSNEDPGSYFNADDLTPPNYFWYQDEETGEYVAARGECLVFIDLRTYYPLNFLLIAGKYNSWHIKKTVTRINDEQGLPDKGFLFEGGIWQARLIAGDKAGQKRGIAFDETENGFREIGINMDLRRTFVHRGKPIENFFHHAQDRFRSEPGFVGFDERHECFQKMQDFLARVRSQKEHPGNELLSMAQWVTRISSRLEELANDPQNGDMLRGRSPAEAWQERIAHRPLRKLSDDARYLLATHKKPVKVTEKGIILTINGRNYHFAGEVTGRYIGRTMLAFFNIDYPELLTVSNMERTEYFTLRALLLPAMTATSAQLSAVRQAISAHTKPAREMYGKIKHQVISTMTDDNAHSEEVKDLGRYHNEAVKVVVQEREETGRTVREIRKRSAELGVEIRTDVRNPDRVLEGLQLEQETRARIAAKKAAAQNTL